MKRQRGRGRKPNGQSNRLLESSLFGQKTRGSASQIYERYQQLARDSSSSGDRVVAENYLQHAEHYFRVMRASQPVQRDNQPNDGRDGDNAADGAEDAEASTGLDVVTPEGAELVSADDDGSGQSGSGQSGDDQPSTRRGRRPRRPRGGATPSDDARQALDNAGPDADTPSLDPAASA